MHLESGLRTPADPCSYEMAVFREFRVLVNNSSKIPKLYLGKSFVVCASVVDKDIVQLDIRVHESVLVQDLECLKNSLGNFFDVLA